MIRVVSWNINKQLEPWRVLAGMAERGEADLALLQEAGRPPGDLAGLVSFEDHVFWNRRLYDRWPLVVRLSDKVEVKWFRQAPPISDVGKRELGVSGIGTLAAAKIIPQDRPQDAFLAFSLYARWMKSHPDFGRQKPGIYADGSAHRILSDLQVFVGHEGPDKHRILAAGDLNMFFGAIGSTLSTPARERTVWERFAALGLEFLGPQAPEGQIAEKPQPDVPADSRNVPTYHTLKQSPQEANRQLDYAFASRGFHQGIRVRALNSLDEWGPSDHCRLLIEIDT